MNKILSAVPRSLCIFLLSSLSVYAANDLPEIPKANIKTSEAIRIREELELIKKDVEQKITRLETAKASYDASRENVETELKKIAEERRLLDETLQKEKTVKADRLKDTVSFVAKMDSKKAAPVLETMDRDLVIALLTKLPQKQVTAILENMAPPKATQFLEYFARIRSGREFEMLKDLGLCSGAKTEETSLAPETLPATTTPPAATGAPPPPTAVPAAAAPTQAAPAAPVAAATPPSTPPPTLSPIQ